MKWCMWDKMTYVGTHIGGEDHVKRKTLESTYESEKRNSSDIFLEEKTTGIVRTDGQTKV